MTEPVRLAVVGCGRIAQVAHLPAVAKADGVQLVAISDPSTDVARAVARRYDVPAAYTEKADGSPTRRSRRSSSPRRTGSTTRSRPMHCEPASTCWWRSRGRDGAGG